MRNYFCGWYFKCQSDTQTVAFIPATHTCEDACSSSLQVITDKGVWCVPFPVHAYQTQKHFRISLGENRFGREGLSLCLRTPDCSMEGFLKFGPLSPIRYDIMGPFRYLPLMECRHSVISMRHSVNGELCINGDRYCFRDGFGYIEGDRGHSFPREYAWTQCGFEGGSLMLSVASIPFMGMHFTGVIAVIQIGENEYRLATYLGAKPIKIQNGELVIRQGDSTLVARLVEKHAHPLLAPVSGAMDRVIHESATCRAAYRFEQKGKVLLEFESDRASFEYEYKS